VPIQETTNEYALAFDSIGRILDHPRVQRYVSDPSYWLKDTKPNVAFVRVYCVDRDDHGHLVIRWREVPDREFDHRE